MLITGTPTQIAPSDVITGWMKLAAFLPFTDSLTIFERFNYALYPHSMLTDWRLGILYVPVAFFRFHQHAPTLRETRHLFPKFKIRMIYQCTSYAHTGLDRQTWLYSTQAI